MTRTYDEPEIIYTQSGWYDGAEDCEPAEPGKMWLLIEEYGEEYCVIVHRKTGRDDYRQMLAKAERATKTVDALNLYAASVA